MMAGCLNGYFPDMGFWVVFVLTEIRFRLSSITLEDLNMLRHVSRLSLCAAVGFLKAARPFRHSLLTSL